MDSVDLGLTPEEESLLLALDIHIEFLKFLEMLEKNKEENKTNDNN